MKEQLNHFQTSVSQPTNAGSGWEEVGWVKTEEANWCSYTKNNGKDGAMVWISWEGNRDVFALMRATK
jgi:hypothetical protein